MSGTELRQRLAAILAADAAGYSRLMAADERATVAALDAARAVFRVQIESHGGRVIDMAGDSILAVFETATGAVSAALAVQQQLEHSSGDVTDDRRMRFRIGVHLGDVIEKADGTVYGDGVNIAARLEGLAAPGGIMVSESIRTAVKGKVTARFEDHGVQQVKHIAEPLRTYQVTPEGDASPEPLPAVFQASLPLPDRLSIAVLPFTNMSGDPEQEYFVDGIVEDIITELSRFSELFVIARNSSFIFKGKTADVKDVARQLGVQYVVEGSVRKSGQRVRVTAQLVDARAGNHVWADRYDRLLEDIFEVQDDLVHSIVAILPGRIAEASVERVRRKPTNNLSAFDYLLRGNHVLARRGDRIREAIDCYMKAIERDPACAPAYAGVAIANGMAVWDLSTYNDNPLQRAYDFGKKAIELDPGDYRCHAAFGEALRQLGEHVLARQHLQRALGLNPNSVQVLGYWAMLQAYTGDPEGAVATYERAVRLDPFSQEHLRKEILAESYYMMHRYDDSNAVLKSMLKLPIFYVHQQIAINYAQLGDMDKCAAHLRLYRASLPASYDERLLFESHLRLCQREEDREHWRQGYRLIGMDV